LLKGWSISNQIFISGIISWNAECVPDGITKEGVEFLLEKMEVIQTRKQAFNNLITRVVLLASIIATYKKFGTLNPMNIYKQVFPRNIPQ